MERPQIQNFTGQAILADIPGEESKLLNKLKDFTSICTTPSIFQWMESCIAITIKLSKRDWGLKYVQNTTQLMEYY